MSDETGKIISEIVDSKIAEKVYDQGLAPAITETGAVLSDVAKTARLFTAPF